MRKKILGRPDLHQVLDEFIDQEVADLHKTVAVDFQCYGKPEIHLWRDDGSGDDIRDIPLDSLVDEFIQWHSDDSGCAMESLTAAAKAFQSYIAKIERALKQVSLNQRIVQ